MNAQLPASVVATLNAPNAGVAALQPTQATPQPASQGPAQDDNDAGTSALAPAGGAPPSGGAPMGAFPKAGALRDLMAGTNAAAQQDPVSAAAPGGWARSLVAGAGHMLAPGIGALGNAAAVGQITPGSGKLGGAMQGISRTLAAGNEQAAQQKQQKFENNIKTEDQGMKKQQNQALMAEAHLRTIQLNQAIQKQDEDVRQESLKSTAAFNKTFVDRGYHQEIMSYAELQKVSQQPGFWDNHVGGKIAEVPMLDNKGKPQVDAKGKIIYNPQYGIIDLRTKPPGSGLHEITDAQSKQIFDATGQTVPSGTSMQDEPYTALMAKTMQEGDQWLALDKVNSAITDAKMRDQLRPDMNNPDVSQAMTAYAGRPIKGLTERMQNTDAHIKSLTANITAKQQKNPNDPSIAKDQQSLDAMQNTDNSLRRVLQFGMSDKAQDAELKAQNEDEKTAHDIREEGIQDKRADIAAKKEVVDKNLAANYGIMNKEFDLVRKPLATQLDSFSTLRNSLDQGTAAGDSVVAPALLKALVAGGGVRITQAEIQNFTHGRSTLEDMKGYLQKLQSGKSITPIQRQQVYALLGAVEAKAATKKSILEGAQTNLDNAGSVAEQRQAVRDARTKLDGLDSPAKAAAAAAPKVGDIKTFPNGAKGVWDGKGYVAHQG